PGLLERAIDVARELLVLGGVRRVPVVERNVEAVQVLRPAFGDARDQLLGRYAFGFRLEHDRRPVRVVRADEMNRVPLHALEAHPDIGLDVLHDVADVKRPIRERESGGDEELTRWHPENYAMGRRIRGPWRSFPRRREPIRSRSPDVFQVLELRLVDGFL